MPQMSGRGKLAQALLQALEMKEDRLDKISGMAGRRGPSGVLELEVDGREGYIWVRIRGQTSEVVQAFNEHVGIMPDLPVLLARDPMQPRVYKVLGRDFGKYQGWEFPLLPKHGEQHSFGEDAAAGRDPVFIYKRQIVQPLLVHPQSVPDMTVYVEADYYFWSNGYRYFAGNSSADLTSSKPGVGLSRFVMVYLDGTTGTVKTSLGTTWSTLFPPLDRVSYIPTIDASVGIPLAAVLLSSETTEINWSELFDIRALLSFANSVFRHGLDPSHGTHTGALDAADVALADPSGDFDSTNAEDAFYEVGRWADEGRMRSWMFGL